MYQDYNHEKALKLDKAIYGLVQAARQFWKKLTSKLKEAGFEPSVVDPCLFQYNDNRGLRILICILIIYCSLVNQRQMKVPLLI